MNLMPEMTIGEGDARREVLEVGRIGGRIVTVHYRHPDGRRFVSGLVAFSRIVRGEETEPKQPVKRERKGRELRKSAIKGEAR